MYPERPISRVRTDEVEMDQLGIGRIRDLAIMYYQVKVVENFVTVLSTQIPINYHQQYYRRIVIRKKNKTY
jgi:hypothetical protein